MKISEIFKNLRLEQGLTQKQLANKLNIGQSTINNYEKEKRSPIPEIIIAYSKFFNVTTDYLLGLEDDLGNKITNNSENKPKNSVLSSDEERLLRAFRSLSELEKGKLIEDAEFYSKRLGINKNKKAK